MFDDNLIGILVEPSLSRTLLVMNSFVKMARPLKNYPTVGKGERHENQAYSGSSMKDKKQSLAKTTILGVRETI